VKYLVATIAILAIGVVIGIGSFLQRQPSDRVQIQLTSDPFPLAVGQTTLLISLTNRDGTTVEDAAVEVTARMTHEGMLPVAGHASESNGQYRAFVTLSMMGDWIVDVSAQLPSRPPRCMNASKYMSTRLFRLTTGA
jgi:hypothetical protein